MAEVNKADVERPPDLTVNFSLGGEESPERTDTIDETTAKDSENVGKKKNKSRFKVALVEFTDDVKPAAEDADGGSSSPASPNPTDTHGYTHYDTNNLKTFGRNTLETLPHLDHYRNLLSATGAMRKRPTLLELHEHDQVCIHSYYKIVVLTDRSLAVLSPASARLQGTPALRLFRLN